MLTLFKFGLSIINFTIIFSVTAELHSTRLLNVFFFLSVYHIDISVYHSTVNELILQESPPA